MVTIDSETIVQLALEIPFGLFHLSMTVFLIVSRIKRKPFFTSAYFLIQVLINFADMVNVVNSLFSIKLSHVPEFKLYYVNNIRLATITYLISAYSAHFEVWGHTLIAYNRYSVMRHLNYPSLWQGTSLLVIICLLFLAPFVSMGFRLPFVATFVSSAKDTVAIVYLDSNVQKYVSYSSVALFTGAFVVTTVFSALAWREYRRLTNLTRSSKHKAKNEFKLLIQSICMNACLSLRILYQVVFYYATITEQVWIVSTAQNCLVYIADLYAFSSSVFLFLISDTVRRGYLRFYKVSKFLELASTRYNDSTSKIAPSNVVIIGK